MRTFEQILENDYHVFLEDNRRDESIKLAVDMYIREKFESEIILAFSEGMKTVDCRPEYAQMYFNEKFKK